VSRAVRLRQPRRHDVGVRAVDTDLQHRVDGPCDERDLRSIFRDIGHNAEHRVHDGTERVGQSECVMHQTRTRTAVVHECARSGRSGGCGEEDAPVFGEQLAERRRRQESTIACTIDCPQIFDVGSVQDSFSIDTGDVGGVAEPPVPAGVAAGEDGRAVHAGDGGEDGVVPLSADASLRKRVQGGHDLFCYVVRPQWRINRLPRPLSSPEPGAGNPHTYCGT
jgi:hypothetical protein